jgi:hypothetical protein
MKSPLTPFPLTQPPILNEGTSSLNVGTTDPRVVEKLVEVVQRLQERVSYLEGHSSEESPQDRNPQRTDANTTSQGVEPASTLGGPPTYTS